MIISSISLRSFMRLIPTLARSPTASQQCSRNQLSTFSMAGTTAPASTGANGFSTTALVARRYHMTGAFESRLCVILHSPPDSVGMLIGDVSRKGLIGISRGQYYHRGLTTSTIALLREGDAGPQKKYRNILPITPHENIYNLPNILTFSRLVASPVIGYLVLHNQYVAAMGLFVVAGLTDLVDGFIARRWNLQTVVGSVIDPMADKTLMMVLTVTLAMQGLLPGLAPSFLGYREKSKGKVVAELVNNAC